MPKKARRSSGSSQIDAKRKKGNCENYKVNNSEDVKKILDNLKHSDPVLQLHLTNTNNDNDDDDDDIPDISLSSGRLLEKMIYPLEPSVFLSTCFRNKAVHISSKNKGRADDISANYMFGLDSKQIFEETSSDSVFLWIPPKQTDEGSGSGKGLQSIEIQDPNTAQILHKNSNYASYCRAPPELEQPMVSNLLKDVGLGLGQYDPSGEKITVLGRGEVETFIGVEGHQTDWHTDFQENFTIQLSGKKKWTLKQGTIKHPIRGTTPHYQSSDDVIENQIKIARLSNPDYQFGKQNLPTNAFGNEVEIIMDAGDVLYFPAGMWHKVETLEYGVSINASLMGGTYASLVCKSLEHILLKREEWREVICSRQKSGIDVIEKLKSLVKDLPSIIETHGACGVAEGMLPPILRTPPAFKHVDDEIEMKNYNSERNDNSNQDEDDDEASEEGHKGGKEEDGIDEDDEDNKDVVDDFDEEEEEVVIDLSTFQLPEEFNSVSPSGKCWKVNPLVNLMRMADVKSFFKDGHSCDEGTKNLYILNCNFGGNDTHESSVRAILRDESGQLEYFCSIDGDGLGDAIGKLKEPPCALIYYGYIV